MSASSTNATHIAAPNETASSASSNAAAAAATRPVPDLSLAQLRFSLIHSLPPPTTINNSSYDADAEMPDSSAPATDDVTFATASRLLIAIQDAAMAPFLRTLAAEHAPLASFVPRVFPQHTYESLLSDLEARNTERLAALDATLAAVDQSSGESDYSEALGAKAHYLASIGERQRAVDAYEVALAKTPGVGAKIDIVLAMLRIAFFFSDRALCASLLPRAKRLIEDGGDWDRRNRCKVYEAIYVMSYERDFNAASKLLLDALPTFASSELVSQTQVVLYAGVAAALTLPRGRYEAEVLDSPDICEFSHRVPGLEAFLASLYRCQYAQFFVSLAEIETHMKCDFLLHRHYAYYVREMRIKAYAQLLESYRSLTLEFMALAFGVTSDFIDRDLFRFIRAGRLNCVIDRSRSVVDTNRPDGKNAQYQQLIKHGDALLNRVQKLSRIISI